MDLKNLNRLLVCASLAAPACAQFQTHLVNPTDRAWTLVARTDLPEGKRRQGPWNGELGPAAAWRLEAGGKLEIPAETTVQVDWDSLPDAPLRILFELRDADGNNPRETSLVLSCGPGDLVLKAGLEHGVESKGGSAQEVGVGGPAFTFLRADYRTSGGKASLLTPVRMPTGAASASAAGPGAGASPAPPVKVPYVFRIDSPGTPAPGGAGEIPSFPDFGAGLPLGPTPRTPAAVLRSPDAAPRTPDIGLRPLEPAGTPPIGVLQGQPWHSELTNASEWMNLYVWPVSIPDWTSYHLITDTGAVHTGSFGLAIDALKVPPLGSIQWLFGERPQEPQFYYMARNDMAVLARETRNQKNLFVYCLNFLLPDNHPPLPPGRGYPPPGTPIKELLAEDGPDFHIGRPTSRRGILCDTFPIPMPDLGIQVPVIGKLDAPPELVLLDPPQDGEAGAGKWGAP